MKHRKIFLKTVALIVAFSVAFVNEGAVLRTVAAADGIPAFEHSVGGTGNEGDGETDGTGNEGDGETGGIGNEGDGETGGIGNEGDGETGGIGNEGGGETGGTGNEGDGETGGIGNEGDGEIGGTGNEGDDGEDDPDDSGSSDQQDSVSDNSVSENSVSENSVSEKKMRQAAARAAGEATAGGNCGSSGNNLTWAYYEETETLVISRAPGSASGKMASYNYSSNGEPYGGPWKNYRPKYLVLEEGVESIGDYAFYNHTWLEGTISFPSTLTEIGHYAFECEEEGASQIEKIVFEAGEGESRSLHLKQAVFSGCSALTAIEFPENLTQLQVDRNNNNLVTAYSNCVNLKEVRIPGSLGKITYAMGFQGMEYLEKVIVEEGIGQIDRYCISVANLREIQLPSTLTEITGDLFKGAANLEKVYPTGETPEAGVAVKLPEGIKSIGSSAFNNCTGLAGKVILPSTLTDIKYAAFGGDSGKVCPITEVIFRTGTEETRSLHLEQTVFSGCSALTAIEFPENLTQLQVDKNNSNLVTAYSNCVNLKEVRIPGSLGKITNVMGFQGMEYVEKVIVEEGIGQIDRYSLPLTRLEEIELPSTLTEIADYLFENAANLEKVYPTGETPEAGVAVKLPEGIKSIGRSAFYKCTGLAGKVILPPVLAEIRSSAFAGNSGNEMQITEVIFRKGTGETRSLHLEGSVFSDCTALTTIEFPDNLTELKVDRNTSYNEVYTYSNCRSLKEIRIPASLGEITIDMGFQGMKYVEKVIVEEGISRIDRYSLPLTSLEEIELPSTLTEIADRLFESAANLKKVYPTGEEPEEGMALKLPEGKEPGGGVKTIGSSAFGNCPSLAGKVSLPTTLTEIKDSAFVRNSGNGCPITEVVFRTGEGESRSLHLADSVFYHCRLLTTIVFPENLTDLRVDRNRNNQVTAYSDCRNLNEIRIPASLGEVTIDMGFQGMDYARKVIVEEGIGRIEMGSLPLTSLEEIELPSTLTEIADGLFYNNMFSRATNLKKVYPTGETPEAGVAVKLPKGIETVGKEAFHMCAALVGKISLPSGLREIKERAFYRNGLTGDLILPDGVERLDVEAFYACSALDGHLYLGDGIQQIGRAAFYSTSIKEVHTGLKPVGGISGSTFSNTIRTVWFRGEDDRDTVTADGKTVGWSALFADIARASSVDKIYIDDTVNRLSTQSFWKNYKDISFVGPNVVTLDGEVFPAAPIPVSTLDGTYYVTEEGVLYRLDSAAGTAALAYCPPGVTDLYIPPFITAAEEMTGEADKQYARRYRVAGVAQHAVMAASDLVSVTAANPQQITLSTRAFADCPTLASVNGVTTQKEANALFGMNGTPAIKKAFVNTALDQDATAPGVPGKPMRSLRYTNPNGGVLTVDLVQKDTCEYREDAYRVLTGNKLTFYLTAEAYGTQGKETRFCVYFEPDDPAVQGLKEYTDYIPYTWNGSTHNAPLKVRYDRVSGCYCFSFSLPAGATTQLKWDQHLKQSQVTYPAGTRGGGLTVWGEVPDFTGAGGLDETEEDDEIFGGFSGNENYMAIDWSTKRNLYTVVLHDRSQRAQVNANTHKPGYRDYHGIALGSAERKIVYREQTETNTSEFGRDEVTSIGYRYVVTLPEGMTWADDEIFAKAVFPKYSGTGKVISISEDRKILTYEFIQPNLDRYNNYDKWITMNDRVSYFQLGNSSTADSLIVLDADWDYYHEDPEKRIKYVCTPTFYYQFSEPDTAATVTAYEKLLPTEAGMVELHRRYSFPEGKGRGLPMQISFEAENKGKDPATLNLQEITDEAVNFNGYLYLSALQMAEAVLSENENLETTKIEIREAVLYQGMDVESGVTHTGTDGSAQVKENLLNAYSEPNPSNKATLTLTVEWPEAAADGDGTGDGSAAGSRRPTKLTISVNGSRQAEIAVAEKEDVDSLSTKIDEALRQAGYLVPTGLYRITWRATDAARSRQIGPYTDTEQKSYIWQIGSYEATVKPDYLQGHRWMERDSVGSLLIFYGNSDLPTAKAVFTLKNDNNTVFNIEELCRDRSYESSQLSMRVTGYDSQTETQVPGQWICPGVIQDYRITYKNGNSVAFGEMPFMQTFDRSQCLLAPVTELNARLGELGYPKLSDVACGGKTFKGRDYYLLTAGEGVQTLEGIWLGGNEGDFYVESVRIGGLEAGEESGQESGQTVIRWYEKEIGPYQGGNDQKNYSFYTYVLTPGNRGERPEAKSTVYANNYIKKADNGTPLYSTRISTSYSGNYQGESIKKDIITNPEAAGTAEENTPKEQRSAYLGAGASVTYRLAFDEYWIGDYTLLAGEFYDLLPCTYGAFEWELNQNVEVKYALKERDVQAGAEAGYEAYMPGGADFARIEKVMEPIEEKGEAVEQYKLSFGDFTIPYNKTLYVYVTLTFPKEQEVWDAFAEAADVNLYNTLYYGNLNSRISHMIARSSQAFLKTGVYGTDGDPYGYIYANSDEEDRFVKYYLVIYNHGKGFLYLNPVHIRIPKGFTLKEPPKENAGGNPDWNLWDVSVKDEDPPDKINRLGVQSVGVSYPGGNDVTKEREAVLNITVNAPWYSYNHDDLVGKEFLWPGEYVAVEVRLVADGYQDTEDVVKLPAAMPIDDSHHVGRIAQVQGVDAHRSNYGNSNEGTPEFWEDNDTAINRGFTVPAYADTGKWAASEVSLTREEAKPGVIKNAPTKMKQEGEEKPYDPQEGVSLLQPVKWETELVNGGANSLTGYRAKDSVQWPYVFDGEVRLASQSEERFDLQFTITRNTSSYTPEGADEAVEKIDRDSLLVNGEAVRIADSREEAMAAGSGCFATVFSGAKVYFYKEDVFGDGHPAETMEFDFTADRRYGVGPASYHNGRVVEKKRTLSYWTKFDLSQMNAASRTSYANRMVMQPIQPYTRADVCEGIAIDENGDPCVGGDMPAGIMDIGYVSVSVGRSTAAWMKVKENRGDEEPAPDVSGSLAEVLTKENKILIGDNDNVVTYTMHVLNHTASGDPDDTVQSAADRRYSIKDLVIINTLPHEGDKMPFHSRVPRNSDYEIIPDQDNFALSVYYYDAPAGGETEAEIPEDRLSPIPAECYQILYNESNTVASADWKFNENSGSGWNQSIPQTLAENGWKSEADYKVWSAEENRYQYKEEIKGVRSIRIEIKDPNTVFDASNADAYRSLMKAGRTIVVKYQAKVKKEKKEDGVEIPPTPGECAWNSFGYRFDRFSEGAAMEASSIRTGVQIPSIPILYEKLIDYEQNPYPNPGEAEEFVFTIDKQEGVRDDKDNPTRTAQQLRFSVKVDTGKSENYRELQNIRNNPEITLWNGEGQEGFTWDGTSFWEDGASYVVKQVTAPEPLPLFSIRVNGQQTTNFVYDGLYEPVIVVTNQSRVWSSRLYKMDVDSKGWDPEDDKDRENIEFLPGALFGLYTTDRMQKVDIARIKEEAGDRYTWRERYKALLDKMMEITYGEGDTAVQLYLKDFAETDENGRIRWLNLEDDTYYVKELNPPPAYRLDETIHPISRKNAVVSVYDEPGNRFPLTGGIGTVPFYLTGAVMLAAGGILGETKGRRRRKKGQRNDEAGARKSSRRQGLIKIGGVTLTFALAVKILLRVIEIRRERRRTRKEKR